MDTVVDWEQLEAVADGFSPEFLEILEELKVETPDLFAKLSDQVNAGNLPDAGRIAHQLKGALANFGFAEAAQKLKALELEARANATIPVIIAKLGEARDAYERGLSELEDAATRRTGTS